MDTIAHALYGGLVSERKKLFLRGIFFSALPDLLTYGAILLADGTAGIYIFATTDGSGLAPIVTNTYRAAHSFLVAALLFLLFFIFKRKHLILPGLYVLHILFDIPFHCGFDATRFLYPISDMHVCGISYGKQYWMWALNYLILALLYAKYFLRREGSKSHKAYKIDRD